MLFVCSSSIRPILCFLFLFSLTQLLQLWFGRKLCNYEPSNFQFSSAKVAVVRPPRDESRHKTLLGKLQLIFRNPSPSEPAKPCYAMPPATLLCSFRATQSFFFEGEEFPSSNSLAPGPINNVAP
jgi:hypothetical protein